MPIRVLMAAPSLEILGGQSRQAARLLERMSKEPTVKVSFLPHNPRLPGLLSKLQSVKYLRTIITSTLYWVMLLIRVPRHDLIHIFSASYYSYLLSVMPAILIAKLYGKRVILNYRSGEAEDHLRNWRWTAVPTMRLADKIVVPSGYLVDVFAQFGLEAQAIYNIVEFDRFPYRERKALRPIFLTTRLLEPLYNVGCILRAFAIIQSRLPQARLTVAGDGWQRKQLEQLARDLGLRNTEFVGRVPFEQMPALYDAADIYLTATDIDNMPGSIIECYAAGLPVVTTDAGGIPYILTNEETGLMVRCGDYKALAASALRLLEDKALASRIAASALERCREFSWTGVRDQWLELYRQLAHTPKVMDIKGQPSHRPARGPRKASSATSSSLRS